MIFQYNNSAIYYAMQGNGPALLLLHGFLESSTMWEEIAPTFYETRTVITMDFPGHGKSDSVAEEHTMELFAEIVNALLDHLNIKKCSVIGHSMGGYVAMAMAELFPHKLEKLVLLNATPAEDSKERKLNRERALQLIPKAKDVFVSMAISNLFAETARKKFQIEIEHLKTEALEMTTEGITAAIKGMKNRKDRRTVLKSFPRPKFMICGITDPILPFQECKIITEDSGTRLFELQVGHMSHIEDTTSTIEIMHFIENNCI
jgi:pimeloyl-ACP methyl ester carboxylesterase